LGFVTSLVTEESSSLISDGEEPPVFAITPATASPPITPQQQQEFRVPSRRETIVVPIQANNTAVDGDQDNFDHDTDEEDEFFDAIENNALPNMLVYEALTSPATIKSPGPQVPTTRAVAATDKNPFFQIIRTTVDFDES
jgi:hypothetical protein